MSTSDESFVCLDAARAGAPVPVVDATGGARDDKQVIAPASALRALARSMGLKGALRTVCAERGHSHVPEDFFQIGAGDENQSPNECTTCPMERPTEGAGVAQIPGELGPLVQLVDAGEGAHPGNVDQEREPGRPARQQPLLRGEGAPLAGNITNACPLTQAGRESRAGIDTRRFAGESAWPGALRQNGHGPSASVIVSCSSTR